MSGHQLQTLAFCVHLVTITIMLFDGVMVASALYAVSYCFKPLLDYTKDFLYDGIYAFSA